MKFNINLCLVLLTCIPVFGQVEVINDSINKMYVGTYTQKEGHVDGNAAGIYLLNQDPSTGSLEFIQTVAKVRNPSFVKVGRRGRYLFAVSELGPKDGKTGFVYSYQIKPDGTLIELSKLSTGANAPCHIALDRSGKFVFVSNYMGGVVAEYKIDEEGRLELIKELKLGNQENSHAHSVKISRDNRFAYIADLGNDRIWIYKFDPATGKLTPHEQSFVKLPEGAGPRHLSFDKNGSYGYSINELNSTLSTFKIGKDGKLEIIQTISSIPEKFKNKNSAADIHIDPEGKFLYASNRGHESIAIFKIESKLGTLTNVDYVPIAGKTPRNFAISPYGKYLYAASQDTGNITIYKINQENGKLKPQEPVFNIKTPVCLEFIN
ncbi:lactonase family protein [Christiangramia aquimixticola]|uniref:lactonase family protein n=1 Tax=Christiangramia aquimixticola TaxID=1697558 RepID=UPI003AA9103D